MRVSKHIFRVEGWGGGCRVIRFERGGGSEVFFSIFLLCKLNKFVFSRKETPNPPIDLRIFRMFLHELLLHETIPAKLLTCFLKKDLKHLTQTPNVIFVQS